MQQQIPQCLSLNFWFSAWKIYRIFYDTYISMLVENLKFVRNPPESTTEVDCFYLRQKNWLMIARVDSFWTRWENKINFLILQQPIFSFYSIINLAYCDILACSLINKIFLNVLFLTFIFLLLNTVTFCVCSEFN